MAKFFIPKGIRDCGLWPALNGCVIGMKCLPESLHVSDADEDAVGRLCALMSALNILWSAADTPDLQKDAPEAHSELITIVDQSWLLYDAFSEDWVTPWEASGRKDMTTHDRVYRKCAQILHDQMQYWHTKRCQDPELSWVALLVIFNIAEACFKAQQFQALPTTDLYKAMMDAAGETDRFAEFLEVSNIESMRSQIEASARANKKYNFVN